MKTAIIKNP